MNLFVAGENIPAGHYVTAPEGNSEVVYGLDPVVSQKPPAIKIIIGIARENLREGFRVAEQNGEVWEDDA